VTLVTLGEALAFNRATPDWVAPFEGMSTAVAGGALSTVTLTGALVVDWATVSVATL
jgi:hypothetical protein